MQSTHRSSKGKGRAGDGDYEDYAQSLASLSLSDCGDLAPRSDSYGQPYTDVYGSSYEQPYAGDNYSWTVPSSLAPMQSSSAVYGSTPAYGSTAAYGSTSGYGSTPGYGNSYSTTPSTSSIGAYGYRNESSATPTYSGYTVYGTASVSSSSVPSSYGPASESGWSEAQSHGTTASSVPSRRSDRTDVNNTINRQRPPNERYQLPCEFHNLTGCTRVFPGDDVQDWMDHVEGHLQSKFPTRLRCWFCNEHNFDARETSEGDVRSNFNLRMQHIRHHIVYEGYRPEQMLKDGHLVQHLLDRNLIDRRTYESIVNPTTVPPVPGDQDRRSSHRNHHSHRHLPQVEEEVNAGPSTRQHRSSEHRREREHGRTSHKQKRRG